MSMVAVCLALLPAFDVVHLHDGQRLVGELVRVSPHVQLRTATGIQRVDSKDVRCLEKRRDLERKLRELSEIAAPQKERGHVFLAEWCLRHGMYGDFLSHLDRCQEQSPTPARVRELLDQAATSMVWEDTSAHGPWESRDIRNMLRMAVSDSPSCSAVARQWLTRAVEDPAFLPGLTRAMRDSRSAVREVAIRSIPASKLGQLVEELVRAAVGDRDDRVRQEAQQALVRAHCQDTLPAYVELLRKSDSRVRQRIYPVLAELGDPRAIPMLVQLLKSSAGSGGSTRGFVSVGTQRSYVRDFDVEIASGAVIAKPVIGVLRSGSVLDATVHGVHSLPMAEVRAIRSALEKLKAANPGGDEMPD